MAGINVPQYDIFKINTQKLSYYNWDLTITKKEAFLCGELVSLFEGQYFRIIADILNKPKQRIDYSDYIVIAEVANKADFKRITQKGFTINCHRFKRFVGTPNGLKNNTLLFINTDILDELNFRCRAGGKAIPIIPSKLEAYKSLTCSASQPICSPHEILVVPDCITHIVENVITIDDSTTSFEPDVTYVENKELENTVTDGFSICTIEYMKRIADSLNLDYTPGGVCLRNAWFKGMLYPFPIKEFFKKYYSSNIVVDIWGNEHNIDNIDMITTESSLKLYKAYDSIDEYVRLTKENGYTWAVTKIAPHELEDRHELNYQYLQSYDFTEDDIKELCSPTVNYLKDALCGDYESTIRFLGITQHVEPNSWQQALYVNSCMLKDPFIIDSVYRMIRKKIDNAKIGKLLVEGNYQICSGDPYMLMESVCSIEPKGLLKKGQVYSNYWANKKVKEIVVFRSPMTSHNNICKCKVGNNADMAYWYQYMNGIMILNGWDTMCQALNGCDHDGDIIFSTNNNVLLRKYRETPAVICAQRKVEKIIPTERDIIKSNLGGMGNQVGTITNRITAMMEVQSHFEKGSVEYETLAKRILSGQLYQQNEIDKLKGIIAKPMPKYWYDRHMCKDDFQRSICVDKKPYFMTYVYDDYRAKYNRFNKEADKKKFLKFGECGIPDEEFIKHREMMNPFGMGSCAMNNICRYIEEQFKGCVSKVKHEGAFDYEFLKYNVEYSAVDKARVLKIAAEYADTLHEIAKKNDHMNASEGNVTKQNIERHYKESLKELVPNSKERYDIVLDLYYGNNINRLFCWITIGDMIVERLKELAR